jgi:hypothetical protein
MKLPLQMSQDPCPKIDENFGTVDCPYAADEFDTEYSEAVVAVQQISGEHMWEYGSEAGADSLYMP